MTLRRPVAAVLLVLMPSSVFAQTLPTAAEYNARVSRPAALTFVSLDPNMMARELQVATCDASKLQGRTDAGDQHGTVGWMAGSLAAGVGLGLIGTGIMLGMTALSSPKPDAIKPNMEETCYRDGYKSKAKNKNLIAALLGGLVGTAVWTAIYVANNNDE